MADLSLGSVPPYSHSGPAPDYRHEPHEEEVTLQHTPRFNGLGVQQSSEEPSPFHKSWPQALALTLHQYQQVQDDSLMPVYSRNTPITGEIEIFNRDSVEEVTATLSGKMDISVTNGGGCHLKVAHQKATLWKQEQPKDPSAPTCPAVLPLRLTFPSTYSYRGSHNHRLPPTYDFVSYALVVLMANCSYHLTIRITRSRKTKLSLWKSSESYSLPLVYRPRTRPIRPLIQDGTPLSYLKACPEEFHQISMSIYPKNRLSSQPPIHCTFLVPSVQTFYLRDSIPAHIQVHGAASSIQQFFCPDGVEQEEDVSNPKKSKVRRKVQIGSSKPVLRIFLARQNFVDVGSGSRSWRTVTIGECDDLQAATPHYGLSSSTTPGPVHLDWTGTVRCKDEVQSVGFVSGPLTVKDFLVFSLTPAYAATCKYPPLHHAHPIRLVTDPWHDETLIHPQDTL